MVLTIESVGELKILMCDRSNERALLSSTFLLVLRVYNVALTFEPDEEILEWKHVLNKTSLAALLHMMTLICFLGKKVAIMERRS